MKEKTIGLNRIIAVIVVLLVMVAGVLVLTRPYTGITETKAVLPAIGASPIYVEMKDGEVLERQYTAPNDQEISYLKLLLVNTTGSDKAKLNISVKDKAGSLLSEISKDISDFTVGDWTDVDMDLNFATGETYTFEFMPIECSPYFMQVEGYVLDISLGFECVTDKTVTYGDVFYYSIPILLLAGLLLISLIIGGTEVVCNIWKRISATGIVKKCGTEIFLILLFVTLSVNIYSTAYIKGVYITSDSNGYLREAVNIIAGNGYSYDGIAGYSSWFANWPIIYPAMIAFMMVLTGANAYLASKFVAILCIALIEIILYVAFKKDAWIYALALTNVGVLNMAYNTWSEIPFMVFMLLFGLLLGKIVSSEAVPYGVYVGLFLSGTATFLTRYFGIFVWVVAGIYWLLIFIKWWQTTADNEKKGLRNRISSGDGLLLKKLIGLAVSAALSGMVYIAYLVMNKIKNGNPTGVSRGTWWDDYKTLTDDLVKSLVTEIFNVFSIDVPKAISDKPVYLQVWFVIIISVFIGILIHKCLDGRGNILSRYMSTECVLIMMAIVYYGMFIVIRYRSSMDTFYFRFFAPATFLLTLGIIGLVLEKFDMSKAKGYLGVFVTVLVLMSLISICRETDFTHTGDYYDITINSWKSAYAQIPEKSVVIWSDVDYRSLWYRSDIVEGELYSDDTPESLKSRYYGSDYMCIRKDYAETILSEGEYDESFKGIIREAVTQSDAEAVYISIALR
ncbi:MAG: hypothetical protein KBS96_01805 [Lachnospiraceae bacterium]|nr:hypothetical protein [Candidatus Colinaster scatohippi]